MTIQLREERVNAKIVDELRHVLKLHEGKVPLRISLRRHSGKNVLLAVPEFSVNPEPSFAADIKTLFGADAIVL